MSKIFYVYIVIILLFQVASAQSSGDYRSKQSGNWEDASSWEIYNGSSWINASNSPDSSSGNISILSSHTITINSNIIANQLTVNGNSNLVVSNGSSLEIKSNDIGTTFTINGTLTADGKVVLSGATVLNGTLTGVDTVTIKSGNTVTWNGGYMTGTGATVIESGASLNLMTATTKYIIQRSVEVYGLVTWSDGVLYGQNSNTITVENGGVFETTFDGTMAWTGSASTWTFTNNGTIRKTTGAGATTFSSFTFINNGTVDIQSGQLNLNNGGTFNDGSNFTGAGITYCITGTFQMNGTIHTENLVWWTAAYTGNHTIVGTLRWYGGTPSGSATDTTRIANGSTLQLLGSSSLVLYTRTLVNEGTVEWSNTSVWYLADGATINNASNGIVKITNDQTLTWNGVGGRGVFNNYGTIRKSPGTGTTSITETMLNNYGTFDVQTGAIVFSGVNNGVSTGVFSLAGGTLMTFNGGSYTWGTGTTISGAGTMQVNGGSVSVTDTVGVPISAQTTLSLASGDLGGNGVLKVYGPMNWSGGSHSGTGRTDIDSATTLTINGSSAKILISRKVVNYGTIRWLDGGVFYGYGSCEIENTPEGLFEMENDATMTWYGVSTGWTFTNNGIIRKKTATGTTIFSSFDFINNGTVDIQSGQLNLNNGGTFNDGSIFSGAGITYCVAGTFQMTGTIHTENLVWWTGAYTGTHTIVGTLQWYGGTPTGNATDTTTIANGSILKAPGASAHTWSARTLINQGTVEWTSSSVWYLQSGAIINNLSNGVFEINNDQTFTWNGVGGRGVFNNYGTIRKSVGTGISYITETAVNNYGVFDVQTGTVVFGGVNGGISMGEFALSGGTLMTFNGGSYTWGPGTTINGAGTMQVNGGGVSVTDTNGVPVSSQTTLSLAGGDLGGDGVLKVYGPMNWSGGTHSGSGRTDIDSMTTLTISSSSAKILISRKIMNYGTIRWLDGGVLYGYGSCEIENTPKGLFEMENDATMTWYGVSTNWTFINSGILRKQTATGATTFSSFNFINNGTVDIQSGQVNLNNGGTFNDGSNFTGAGITYCITGTFQMNGTIHTENLVWWTGAYVGTHTIVGTLQWYGGTPSGALTDTTKIASGSTLKIAGSGSIVSYGRTLVNEGTIEWSNSGVWYFANGAKVVNSPIGLFDARADNHIEWYGVGERGDFDNQGILRKSVGSGQTYFGETYVTNSGTIEANSGLLSFYRLTNVSGTSLIGGTYKVKASLRINNINVDTNKANIILDSTAASLQNWSGGNALSNFITNSSTGSFTIQNGNHYTSSAPFSNYGKVTVKDSSVFSSPGNYTQALGRTILANGALTAGSMVDIQNGALIGNGTVNGVLNNSDSLFVGATPGTLTVNGDYIQNPSSDIYFEVGGHNSSSFDRLYVTGTSILGGRATTVLINGFVPLQGDTFALLTTGTRNGEFDFHYGLAIDSTRSFDPRYDSTHFYVLTFDIGVPHLISPPNDTLNLSRTVIHRWNETNGLADYRFQFSDDSTFATTIVDTLAPGGLYKVSGMSYLTHYYWRVRGQGRFASTAWSEIWGYTTIIEAPGSVQQVSPQNSAVDQSVTPLFHWNTSVRASQYELQLSTDSTFSSVGVDTLVSDTAYQAIALNYLQKYFWRVRARNVGGIGLWSAVYRFTTIIEAPAQVDLSLPLDSIQLQPLSLTLAWKSALRAESYRVQVSQHPLFASIMKDDTTAGDTSYHLTGLENLTRYYWRIQSRNIGGVSAWSAIRNFVTIIAPPEVPQLRYPIQDSILVNLHASFHWLPSQRAENYIVEVSIDSAFASSFLQDTTSDTVIYPTLPAYGQKYFWRVKGLNVGGESGFSLSRSFTVTEFYATYARRWNLVSLPVAGAAVRKSDVYPTATSSAYLFNAGAGYTERDTLEVNRGYWLKFPGTSFVQFSGNSRDRDTIPLVHGWNLIGSISSPLQVSNIIQEPPGFIQSSVWGYDVRYETVDTIQPGKGYWLYANGEGNIILDKNIVSQKKNVERKPAVAMVTFTVTDAAGNSQTLHIDTIEEGENIQSLLPPIPPTGVFDVRFSTGTLLEHPDEQLAKKINVLLSSAEYPVTITWNVQNALSTAKIHVDGISKVLSQKGTIKVESNESIVSVTLAPGRSKEIPEEFALQQNYPNPFNPSTVINYQLPTDNFVTINVYNMLGEVVATLVDGVQPAGFKSVTWEAGGMPSGIYYYRINIQSLNNERTHNTFTDVKKMLLLK